MKTVLLMLLLILGEGLCVKAAVEKRDPFLSLLPKTEDAGKRNVSQKQKGITGPVYVKEGGELADFKLEGIIDVDKGKEAIINGKVYGKGDKIKEGAEVTKIKKNEVYIYYKDRIYVLSLIDKIKLEVK